MNINPLSVSCEWSWVVGRIFQLYLKNTDFSNPKYLTRILEVFVTADLVIAVTDNLFFCCCCYFEVFWIKCLLVPQPENGCRNAFIFNKQLDQSNPSNVRQESHAFPHNLVLNSGYCSSYQTKRDLGGSLLECTAGSGLILWKYLSLLNWWQWKAVWEFTNNKGLLGHVWKGETMYWSPLMVLQLSTLPPAAGTVMLRPGLRTQWLVSYT